MKINVTFMSRYKPENLSPLLAMGGSNGELYAQELLAIISIYGKPDADKTGRKNKKLVTCALTIWKTGQSSGKRDSLKVKDLVKSRTSQIGGYAPDRKWLYITLVEVWNFMKNNVEHFWPTPVLTRKIGWLTKNAILGTWLPKAVRRIARKGCGGRHAHAHAHAHARFCRQTKTMAGGKVDILSGSRRNGSRAFVSKQRKTYGYG
jgi:hypothetical protein